MRGSLVFTEERNREPVVSFPGGDLWRLLPYLPLLANVVLVVLIGLTAARLFWALWPVESPSLPPAAVQQRDVRSLPGVEVDVQRIVDAHLFGRRAVEAEDGAAIDAPETRLDLTLTGIVADASGGDSWALISEGEADQQAYTVDDGIAENVAVHAIHWNRVILRRNGRFETLTLQLDEGGDVQRVAGQREGGQAQARLRELRDRVLDDPSNLSRYVRFQAHKEDGKLVGMRIYPGSGARDLFTEVGLRPGDIVTSVNDLPVDGSIDLSALGRELRNASYLNLTLSRGGQQHAVTLTLQ